MFTQTGLYVSAACYVLPKIGAYLTTRPREQPPRTRLNEFREGLAHVHAENVEMIGRRDWNQFVEIIVDNAWISVLAVNVLVNRSNQPPSDKTAVIPLFMILCPMIWGVRYGIAKWGLPFLHRVLAPRSLQHGSQIRH